MAAQKCKKTKKKKFGRNFFAFLNPYCTKTHLIKALNSLDSSRRNGKSSQNLKTGGFRKLFLPKNDFETCSAVNFPKKHSESGGLETNRRHEMPFYI